MTCYLFVKQSVEIKIKYFNIIIINFCYKKFDRRAINTRGTFNDNDL